jgi:SAM-dependent methyltransferase
MTLPDIHLDLGCGKFPRNPYDRAKLCGIDIRGLKPAEGFEFMPANLALEPIPYPDNVFGSVSAFDFIEHVPRILVGADGAHTFFPFVRLMDEVWRVLAPGGLFYALTPTWPSPDVFVDPTHVNVITEKTHEYFCGENPLGRMYGFRGHFVARRAQWVVQHRAFKANPAPLPPAPLPKRLAYGLRDAIRHVRGRRPQLSYFLWELEAVKMIATARQPS